MAGITPQAAFDAACRHMRSPFQWGLRRDCTAACEAFLALCGVDPLEGCQAAYNSRFGAARILRRAGGYLAWCERELQINRADRADAGDLALVESADPFGAALAICITPGEFASKTETGMAITRAQIIGAWSCRF